MEVNVTSSAFADGGKIGSRYTCDGENVSPPLAWETDVEGVMSFALICDDPDAPMGTFVHWVVYNLPADANGFGEDVPGDAILANGARQGMTDFGKVGYGGPCPPSGSHRYYFKVYALDVMLDLGDDVNKSQLLAAMEGHVLSQGQIMGRYQRRQR